MPASCILMTCDDPQLRNPAAAFLVAHFDVRYISTNSDAGPNLFPDDVRRALSGGDVEYLFSFLSSVIVPTEALNAVKLAINFHPAPPRWPGIGGASYALYHSDKEFGVTAHVMMPLVDSGAILRVDRFPILPTDDEQSLLDRASHRALSLLYDVGSELALAGTVSPSGDEWERRPMTMRQFRDWMTLSTSDDRDDVERKIRAVRHPNLPGPFLEFHGHRFAYVRD
jgi:methionyl-tRNA formyltransferase